MLENLNTQISEILLDISTDLRLVDIPFYHNAVLAKTTYSNNTFTLMSLEKILLSMYINNKLIKNLDISSDLQLNVSSIDFIIFQSNNEFMLVKILKSICGKVFDIYSISGYRYYKKTIYNTEELHIIVDVMFNTFKNDSKFDFKKILLSDTSNNKMTDLVIHAIRD